MPLARPSLLAIVSRSEHLVSCPQIVIAKQEKLEEHSSLYDFDTVGRVQPPFRNLLEHLALLNLRSPALL